MLLKLNFENLMYSTDIYGSIPIDFKIMLIKFEKLKISNVLESLTKKLFT